MVEKMTIEQIEQMPAGPEMDALIESEIYGAMPLTDDEWMLIRQAWQITSPSWVNSQRPLKIPISKPDEQTGAMYTLGFPQDFSGWQGTYATPWLNLVKRMRRDGWLFKLGDVMDGEGKRKHSVANFSNIWNDCTAAGETDALAVCRAALKTKALNKRGEK
jgi:hypothetical protein